MGPHTKTAAADQARPRRVKLKNGRPSDDRVRTLLFAALAAATLTLAGCVQPPANDEAVPPGEPDPLSYEELRQPTLLPDLDLGIGDGEPSIAVAPNGTIYVSAISQMFRSDDGGKTFKPLGEPGCAFPYGNFGAPCPPGKETTYADTDGHGDGDITVTPDGRLHWLGLFGSSDSVPYQASEDGGQTFGNAEDLADGASADRQWIDSAPDGSMAATWRDFGGSGVVAFRLSEDGGATWGEPSEMAPDAVGGPVVHGPVPHTWYEAMTTFADTQGAPGGTGGGKVVLARTQDDGAHWNLSVVFEPPQSAQLGLIGFATSIFPVVALDTDGTVYVAFSADQRAVPTPAPAPKSAARFGVYLAVSHDDGATFSPPVLISDPAHAAIMPAMVAGAPGRVAIAWYENEHGMPNDSLPDIWDVMLWQSTTAGQAQPASIIVQLNTEPAHIGTVCTQGAGCLAGDRTLLDFFEVALDIHGNPVATWSSSLPGGGIGVNPQETRIHFGGVADGADLLHPVIAAPDGGA